MADLKLGLTGEELINDKDIDAVIVTTEDAYHAQYVKAAITASNLAQSGRQVNLF